MPFHTLCLNPAMTPTRGLSPFFVGGHLRLADKLLLKSYDALPVGAIRNGALLVPGVSDTAQPTGEFWALESTREHAERPHFHARAHTALPVPNASQ